MSVILLTGPAAAGKNTIANALAQRQEQAADIDVDLVRWMYRKPHHAPWEGEEGIKQMKIGVEHACLLAKSFVAKGLTVFLSDVVTNETIKIYQEQLGQELRIIQLLPSWGVALERLKSRQHTISDKEARWVYDSQLNLKGWDHQLDTSQMTIDETVQAVERLLGK
jgi:cytidylate kinase